MEIHENVWGQTGSEPKRAKAIHFKTLLTRIPIKTTLIAALAIDSQVRQAIRIRRAPTHAVAFIEFVIRVLVQTTGARV